MPAAVVVFVHGLWMTGAESLLLRRRLANERGYGLKVFRYASVGMPPAHIIAALRNTIAAVEAPRVHLIGHSLGGLMILRCLERYPMAQTGRVVFLGTPAARSPPDDSVSRLWDAGCLVPPAPRNCCTSAPRAGISGANWALSPAPCPWGLGDCC